MYAPSINALPLYMHGLARSQARDLVAWCTLYIPPVQSFFRTQVYSHYSRYAPHVTSVNYISYRSLKNTNYACNNKRTRTQYIDWIEEKWRLKVDKSTITRILQAKDVSVAANSLEVLVTQQEGANEYVNMANRIEKFIKEKQISLLQQTALFKYFSQ